MDNKRGYVGRFCCCFLNVVWKILLGIVILTGLASLILCLVFAPQKFKFHVTNAALTEFNLANTTTTPHPNLYYNLVLDLTVRNPNKKLGVHFEEMAARVFYEGHRITQKNIGNFFLEKKCGKNHKFTFKGQTLFLLNESDLKELSKDKAYGVYCWKIVLTNNVEAMLIMENQNMS